MLHAILSDPLAAAARGNIVANVFAPRSRWQNHRCGGLPLANNRCGVCCLQPILSTYLIPEQCVGHCPSSLPSKHKFSCKALGLWGFFGLDCSPATCKWILFIDTCSLGGEVRALAPERLPLSLPSGICHLPVFCSPFSAIVLFLLSLCLLGISPSRYCTVCPLRQSTLSCQVPHEIFSLCETPGTLGLPGTAGILPLRGLSDCNAQARNGFGADGRRASCF